MSDMNERLNQEENKESNQELNQEVIQGQIQETEEEQDKKSDSDLKQEESQEETKKDEIENGQERMDEQNAEEDISNPDVEGIRKKIKIGNLQLDNVKKRIQVIPIQYAIIAVCIIAIIVLLINIINLQGRYTDLSDDYLSLQEEVDRKERELESKEKEVTNLKSENDKLVEKNSNLTIEVSKLEEEIDELENGAKTQLATIKNHYEKGEWQKVIDLAKKLHEKYNGSAEDTEAQQLAQASQAELDKIKAAEEEKKARGYETGITFDQLARNPDDYYGEKVKFYGEVVQVMEKSDGDVQLRLSVDDNYNNVIYCECPKSLLKSRILEDDHITIYGTSLGTITYETVLGSSVTIPAVYIEKIDQ